MVSEWAKPWATLNISAALLCKLKVSCRFPGAQTHVSGGNTVSIRIKKKKKQRYLYLKLKKLRKAALMFYMRWTRFHFHIFYLSASLYLLLCHCNGGGIAVVTNPGKCIIHPLLMLN